MHQQETETWKPFLKYDYLDRDLQAIADADA